MNFSHCCHTVFVIRNHDFYANPEGNHKDDGHYKTTCYDNIQDFYYNIQEARCKTQLVECNQFGWSHTGKITSPIFWNSSHHYFSKFENFPKRRILKINFIFQQISIAVKLQIILGSHPEDTKMQAVFSENSQSISSGHKNKVSFPFNQGWTDRRRPSRTNFWISSCSNHVATAFCRVNDPSKITTTEILTVL